MTNTIAENLARSANEPMIKQQVIVANAAWKAMNTYSGITMPLLKVAATESGVMPCKNKRSSPPMNARGLFLVGLDLIGAYVTEINVTSPTCFVEITEQSGFDVSQFWLTSLEKALT